jgi:hypothetical protein
VDLAKRLKGFFYPESYPEILKDDGDNGFTLQRADSPARYVMHVQRLDSDLPITKQIQNARESIFKRSRAFWLLREVGACIIFTCDKLPDIEQEELVVDKTGFHAVIIQGVYIISKENNLLFLQSKWFNRAFGKSAAVLEALRGNAI